jgi:hypothetical protein
MRTSRSHLVTAIVAALAATAAALVAAGGLAGAHNAPSQGHVRLAHTVDGLTIRRTVVVAPSAIAATYDAARTSATRVTLATSGPFTVYAKCFKEISDPSNPGVFGEISIRTTRGGAVFSSEESSSNNGFLRPTTPETSRRLLTQSSFAGPGNPGTLNVTDADRGSFYAAAKGAQLQGTLFLGTKVGSPAAGDGLFGAGDRCLFGGTFTDR